MIHYAKAEKGTLVFDQLQTVEIQLCALEGKDLSVEIKRAVKKRSNPQNEYYWGVVIPISVEGFKDTGNLMSDTEVHEFYKQRFNYKLVEVRGYSVKIGKSTAKLNTIEFSEYIKKIRDFADNWLSVYIPEPTEFKRKLP